MSYYNYFGEELVTIDMGVAGEQEVYVDVDIDINYRDIMEELGEDAFDYVDVSEFVLHNYHKFMKEVVGDACTEGLRDLVECLISRYEENGEEAELQTMIEKAQTAIMKMNDVEQGVLPLSSPLSNVVTDSIAG